MGCEPTDGFEIVGNDVGTLGNHYVDKFGLTLKVGYECLKGNSGTLRADGADEGGPVGSSTIRKVIAVNGGHNGVFKRTILSSIDGQ